MSPLTGLPQFQLGKSIVDPEQYSGPTLYKKSPEANFLALLGLSKKDLYEAKLRQLGIDEAKGG
jgi:hypothetical protein